VPYRSARAAGTKLTPEAGIALDMVRQFADRHAFLRELVQNGIDAGATRIDVRVERSPDGAVRTTVEDDGCGMTRAIIEGPLLTLFQSSKESDKTKIGKYGIGFMSVFAIDPDRVDVRTRRAGEAWLVSLFGDHSFELSTAPPRSGTGTHVTLLHTMTADELAVHAELTKGALTRWCKHSHVPITFVAVDGYDGGEVATINTPMTLPGLASLTVTEGDERFVVAVGAPGSFSGFYNHGLTLMESSEAEPALESVYFKIDSPRLSHTMSRDSIRRDDESRRLIERVGSLVVGPLAAELGARIAEAAIEAASAPSCERYAALLGAYLTLPGLGNAEALVLPLLEPLGGATTMLLGEATHGERTPSGDRVLFADATTPLTRAVAATGRAVVRHLTLAHLLRGALGDGTEPADVESVFAYAHESADHAGDGAMLAELARLLSAAGRKVARARVASFHGSSKDSPYRVVKTAEDAALLDPTTALRRRWGTEATLFLNVEHATVRLARRRAKTEIALAAQLLCRTILLDEGPLDAKVVDRLLDAAAATVSGHG